MRKLLDIGLKQMDKILREMSETTIECLNAVEDLWKGKINNMEEKSSKLRLLREELLDIGTELLVRYQPMASDLRYIQASIDVSYDLYRISRYSMEIERTLKITGVDCEFGRAKETLKTVRDMVEKAVEAFMYKNEVLVGEVIKMDNDVDEAYINSLERLNQEMSKCTAIEALIIRHLERMSDHARSIAGEAAYVKSGKRV
ncbi:PhoU family transcriptional regulator [Thermococcus sp. P6]|nr:PhoU family transcriptional regulator [Thermococcus sp. P6]